MKLMTSNCRGLVGPLKRPTLKRVVNLENPDVILLHEILQKGEEVKSQLEGMLSGW
jgi:hypothetical protein